MAGKRGKTRVDGGSVGLGTEEARAARGGVVGSPTRPAPAYTLQCPVPSVSVPQRGARLGSPLNDGRKVRLRRWRHLLRRLGGGQGARARNLHGAQGAGGVLGLLVPRFRGCRWLHLAQRQHVPGLLGAGEAPRAGRGDEGQVDVPGGVVARLQRALWGPAEPLYPRPLRGHLE